MPESIINLSCDESQKCKLTEAHRIRKVKCDEAKPVCQRCTSTGRKCDGYSMLPFSRRELAAASSALSKASSQPSTPRTSREPLLQLINDPAFSDVLEKRHFQFFRMKSVASANALFASHFWDRTVLQACHTTPAIKHAVLALSSWHQASNGGCEQQYIDYADDQYRMALQHARALVASADEHDLDKVLIACIIFICFEGVRGHYKASQLHMDHGRAICRQHKDHFRQNSRRNDLQEISHALARLELPVLGWSDDDAPYHYTVEDFHETDPNLKVWEFKDLHEARTSLVDLSRWLLVSGHYITNAKIKNDASNFVHLQAQKLQASNRLYEWQKQFERVVSSDESTSKLLVLNLRQWYQACMILSEAEAFGPEIRYDCLMHRFKEVVESGEEIVQRLAVLEQDSQMSISYEVGYVMPCFLAAQRCRDPLLRRRAINVLLAIPRQEGLWGNFGAAAIAQRWIEIEEEGGLITVDNAPFVPEGQRVAWINTRVLAPQQEAHVVFCFADERKQNRPEMITWHHLTATWRHNSALTDVVV